MSAPQAGLNLLGTRRFLPLFLAQFIGAFNDNIFRNALVIWITFRMASENGHAQLLVTLAAGIFILPFFLFSATAGQLADKYDRAKLIQIIKGAEVVCMVVAAASLFIGNAYLMLLALFLTGMQSAFFGPLKYSIIPDLLPNNELVTGNALVEAGTFLAILLGTIFGGLLVLESWGPAALTSIMIIGSLVSWWVTYSLPHHPPASPDLRIHWGVWKETCALMGMARQRREVFLSILGISWFWFAGSVFLSQFPAFAQVTFHADQHVVTLFFFLFSVGIGVGSLLCNKLMKGEIHATYVPLGALGLTLFTLDLSFASLRVGIPDGPDLIGVMGFLALEGSWRVVADIILIAVSGGLYTVPLYAIMQSRADEASRARIIAANNVYNALFMVVAALSTTALLALHFTVTQVFLVIAVLNLGATVIVCRLLPMVLLKTLVRGVLRLLFHVKQSGVEHYHAAGERVVIVANHVSFLDAMLLVCFLPRTLTFAINSTIASQWWVKPFLSLVDALPMDPTNPLAMKGLIEVVKQGRQVVIFPEGRITTTGTLMKMYQGPGMVVDKTDAVLLPIRISGAEMSFFSRLGGQRKRRFFPRIRIDIQPPVQLEKLPASLRGKQRRIRLAQQLSDVMAEMLFNTRPQGETLFTALVEAMHQHGGRHIIAEDIRRTPVHYRGLLTKVFALGAVIARQVPARGVAGVMLPNSVAGLVTFFAMHATGRIPAMLNFSTGLAAMKAACEAAQIRQVYTSRAFITQAKLEGLVEALILEGVQVWYLEDLAKTIGPVQKIFALIGSYIPLIWHRQLGGHATAHEAAVVLFTSGSEGTPKGVVLSHDNLLSNRWQLATRVDFGPKDRVFNALPMFHSFGLTGATLLPVLSGIRVFFYPSPLHYRIVPELVYDTNATIFFGTDTFLAGYAKYADPYDFFRIRYVFSGAEKVKDSTRKVWMEKYGVRILEGYGATETSPALSLNTSMFNRLGTVGRLLPGMEYQLEEVPGVEAGGRLWVKGPNVMLGYLKADNPGVLQPPEEGWYDTGDIVDVDEQRYITILGRAKRFAKVGGEMVSLTAVEDYANRCWPHAVHAVVAVPDAKKGEQLVLFTDKTEASRAELQGWYREHGVSELFMPRTITSMRKLPILPTGKVDYPALLKEALGDGARGA